MIGEFLFAVIGLSVIVLLLRLIAKHKGRLTIYKSFLFGLIILIVVIVLLILLKR
jgi:hypothetical protein